MPYYQGRGWKKNDMPLAELYYNRCLSLPLFPTLSDADQEFVIKKVFDFYA
jgi:hypothetical protein